MIVVEELRRCIRRRPAECIEVMLIAIGLCAEPEVPELDVFFWNNQNVFRFDVSMNVSKMMLFGLERSQHYVRGMFVIVSPCVELRAPIAEKSSPPCSQCRLRSVRFCNKALLLVWIQSQDGRAPRSPPPQTVWECRDVALILESRLPCWACASSSSLIEIDQLFLWQLCLHE